ncbi:hypothetical protein Prudu_015805, partial [Prunus dulcis]
MNYLENCMMSIGEERDQGISTVPVYINRVIEDIQISELLYISDFLLHMEGVLLLPNKGAPCILSFDLFLFNFTGKTMQKICRLIVALERFK